MKPYTTLIRMAKRTLDDLRRQQVALERQKEQLLAAHQKLAEELNNEQKLAAKTPEMGSFFGGFAKRIKTRQQQLKEEERKIESELIKLADEIMTAFADLKKYEIALENARAKKRAEENRKETIMLDEIAATRYLREQQD